MPICKVDHIKDAVFYMQASGIKVIAATEKTDNTIYDVSFKEPCAIVMGSEGKGINPSVIKVSVISPSLFGSLKSNLLGKELSLESAFEGVEVASGYLGR